MAGTTVQRRARVEQMRAEQARQERRSRLVIVGSVAAIVALVAAGVVGAVLRAPAAGSTSAASAVSIAGLRTFTGLSRDHVTGTVSYPQTPPAGGAHAAVWQNCGWYEQPVASENAVHSLEHSAVWVTYRPDLSSADHAQLKSELSGKAYVLASAYPGLPGPVVASAWGKQVVLDGVSDARLMRFIDAFAGGSDAPEPGGECSGGTGTPS